MTVAAPRARAQARQPPPTHDREPNLRDIAYQRLQKLWVDRAIQPGQWLSQRQVVEMTAAPLAAVRDALKRMEAEGLVVLKPKRGVLTLEITPAQISEIYDFRIMIEAPAAGRLAQRPDMAALGAFLAEARALYATRLEADAAWDAELPNRIESDLSFHRHVIGRLDNAFLADVFERALARQRLYRLTFPGSNRRDGVALAEHIDILSALVDGRPDAAVEAMRAHLEQARRRVLDIS